MDHQAADDPAAERAALPGGLLLPGGTLLRLRDVKPPQQQNATDELVAPWNISGVLSEKRGQDGGRGAGHQEQEGAT